MDKGDMVTIVAEDGGNEQAIVHRVTRLGIILTDGRRFARQANGEYWLVVIGDEEAEPNEQLLPA